MCVLNVILLTQTLPFDSALIAKIQHGYVKCARNSTLVLVATGIIVNHAHVATTAQPNQHVARTTAVQEP